MNQTGLEAHGIPERQSNLAKRFFENLTFTPGLWSQTKSPILSMVYTEHQYLHISEHSAETNIEHIKVTLIFIFYLIFIYTFLPIHTP
jgi:hypothetical protein